MGASAAEYRFPIALLNRGLGAWPLHFDRVVGFWRANAGGKKSYWLVNFDNITINVAELEFYATPGPMTATDFGRSVQSKTSSLMMSRSPSFANPCE